MAAVGATGEPTVFHAGAGMMTTASLRTALGCGQKYPSFQAIRDLSDFKFFNSKEASRKQGHWQFMPIVHAFI
jgi:hypothetical protein